jgi:flagellar hook-basal body complex protein FliE
MISAASIANTVSAVSAEPAGFSLGLAAQQGIGKQLGGSDFSDLLRGSIGKVEELEQQARRSVEGLMRGTGVDVHDALIAAEKANAAFELTLSMRNKAIQSYQSVMSMQF